MTFPKFLGQIRLIISSDVVHWQRYSYRIFLFLSLSFFLSIYLASDKKLTTIGFLSLNSYHEEFRYKAKVTRSEAALNFCESGYIGFGQTRHNATICYGNRLIWENKVISCKDFAKDWYRLDIDKKRNACVCVSRNHSCLIRRLDGASGDKIWIHGRKMDI